MPRRSRRRLFRVYRTALRVALSLAGWRLACLWRGPEARERALARLLTRSARRVRRTIEEVQGLYIKVGQLLSVLTHALPEAFRSELEGLQDSIPSRPVAEIEAQLEAELGGTAAERFSRFDPEALASASLAQVHAATTHEGQEVAVKVQHQGIEELARLDLATISRLIRIAQWITGIRGLDTAFAEVREMIAEELDFEREAENLEAIAAAFEDDPGVRCPRVTHGLSSRRVLTTELVEGTKVSDLAALGAQGIDPEDLAERILQAYCRMIFEGGLYHADPHPGNLLIRPDGGIVFLDFGAVSRLSPALRDGLPKLVEGVLRRDKGEILHALRHMGFVIARPGDPRDGGSEEIAERAIEYFYSRFLEQIELESWNLQDIRLDTKLKMEVIQDLSRLDISLRELAATFRVPKEWILLQRTLVLLLGLTTHLHPRMQPMVVIRPYLEEFVLGQGRDWAGIGTRAVKDLALSVLTVPADLKSLLAQARRGEARLRIHGLPESARLLYALGHQLLYALLALGTGAGALFTHGGESELTLPLALASTFFLLCLAVSILRARRTLRRLRRPPRR